MTFLASRLLFGSSAESAQLRASLPVMAPLLPENQLALSAFEGLSSDEADDADEVDLPQAQVVNEKVMLIQLLDKVMGDDSTRVSLIEVMRREPSTEVSAMLLQLLDKDDVPMREKVEELSDLELDWVMVEPEGEEPGKPPGYEDAEESYVWKSGKVLWKVGKFSGNTLYEVYVQSSKVKTLVFLGSAVWKGPHYALLRTLVSFLFNKVL